jgi:glycosyltransferase involved in cell wall biosynthesis
VRVLFWSEVFWPSIGGAQTFAVNLLRGLRERGHEFMVITQREDLDLPQEARFKGIPVYRFPFYTALADGNLGRVMEIRQQVTRLKRTFAPDLVHTSCFGPSVLFHLDTAKAHPAPLLVTLHSERYEPVRAPDTLLERTLRAAHWVTAPSVRTTEYARQLVPGFTPRASVIYNGLEVPPLPPDPLPVNPPQLLCLGRLSPEKGFDSALAAFSLTAKRFPRVRLMVAGDGPVRSDLEQRAVAMGLTRAVDFVGWVAPAQVPRLLNSATAVVIPSRQEALPLVALEAALMARPVVATRVGGLPEVVVHRQTGLLVEPEDPGALAAAMADVLEHPETAERMGQAARSRAREVFSLERCVAAYDALYRTLAREGSSIGSAVIPFGHILTPNRIKGRA